MKRYKVTLDAEERQALHELIAAGKAAARKLTHARILLKADAADGGPAWPDGPIAEALEVSVATVERVRQRFVEQGLDAALDRKRRERPGPPAEARRPGRGPAHRPGLLGTAGGPGGVDHAAPGRQAGRARRSSTRSPTRRSGRL